jgi:DNA-binding NarL/FixJ family response regulator
VNVTASTARPGEAGTAQTGEVLRLDLFRPSGDTARTGRIGVLVADGHAITRTALGSLLSSTPDIALVGLAGTAGEALTLTERARPDVVVIDADLPEADVAELTRLILVSPGVDGTEVLILTGAESTESAIDALRAGASAVVHKDNHPGELIRALRLLAHRQTLPILLPRRKG